MQNWDINLLRRSTPKMQVPVLDGHIKLRLCSGRWSASRHVCNQVLYQDETKQKLTLTGWWAVLHLL